LDPALLTLLAELVAAPAATTHAQIDAPATAATLKETLNRTATDSSPCVGESFESLRSLDNPRGLRLGRPPTIA
jgi:hypothetical protein